MSKFTKVKKWAEEKGFTVEEVTYKEVAFLINVEPGRWFAVEVRESSRYYGVRRGWTGDAAGMYMTFHETGRRSYSDRYDTQQEMIDAMERELRQVLERK
jgi:hypothetical protein